MSVSSDHLQGKENQTDAVDVLEHFLDNLVSTFQEPSRRECPSCTASRSIYCYDCCEILSPKDRLPEAIQEGVELPFSVDLILDDRRPSSTGVQAASVLNMRSARNTENNYRLLDQSRGAGVPDYSAEDGVFFLFPSESSVGLSSVAVKIRKLVVLDCKWTKSRMRKDPRLVLLPKVHLDNPPQGSFFWRWHNSGAGMLSTIEALYFAAWEVADQQSWSLDRRRALVNLLWIFGKQRAVIKHQYATGNGHRIIPYMPFSEEGKEFARNLRIIEEKEKQKKHGR